MVERSGLKYAQLTNTTKDEKDFETVQVSAYEETFNVHLVMPYGLYANPPMDSVVLCLNMGEQEENRAGIAYHPTKRVKGLAPTEVGIGNPFSETLIKFNKDGDVEIQVKRDLIVTVTRDCKVTIDGNADVNIKGDATVKVDGDASIEAANASVTAATIDLNGYCTLGGGSLGIARLTDTVQVTITSGSSAGVWDGVITSASSNHKAS